MLKPKTTILFFDRPGGLAFWYRLRRDVKALEPQRGGISNRGIGFTLKMSPRWGFKKIDDNLCYQNIAPLGLRPHLKQTWSGLISSTYHHIIYPLFYSFLKLFKIDTKPAKSMLDVRLNPAV